MIREIIQENVGTKQKPPDEDDSKKKIQFCYENKIE